jgi:hypothetical protein
MQMIHLGFVQPLPRTGNKFQFRWKIPNLNLLSPVQGKVVAQIRVTTDSGEHPGFSRSFLIYLGVPKTIKIDPSTINNHSAQPPGCSIEVPPPYQNIPGTARVGHHFFKPGFEWCGFIFRPQVVFSFSPLANKMINIIHAELILEKKKHVAKDTRLFSAFGCMQLTEPTSDGMNAVGINIKDFKPGRSSTRVDVTTAVAEWNFGNKPNLGFLILGKENNFKQQMDYCITWYNCKLEIVYVEKVN